MLPLLHKKALSSPLSYSRLIFCLRDAADGKKQVLSLATKCAHNDLQSDKVYMLRIITYITVFSHLLVVQTIMFI